MNKFSKTSYPRHINQNNFLYSAQQSRESKNTIEQSEQTSKKHKLHQYDNSHPLHNLIEKKIEIDPSLLFSGKNNTRGAKGNNQFGKSNNSVHRDMCSTSKDGFYPSNKERPQSKQQSRVRVTQNLSLNKKKQEISQRPQTSKGMRNVVYGGGQDRKRSLADECQCQIQINRSAKTAQGSRRRNTAKQLELKTSIDPEFLALFAS